MPRFSRLPRRIHLVALAVLAALSALAVACGGGGYSDDDDAIQPPTTSTSATPAASPTQIVSTRGINGVGDVLVTLDGFTLYTFTSDMPNTSNCNGECTEKFPPLATTEVALAKPAGVSGSLSLIARADGTRQVALDGHPLYRYVGDTSAGQANGQGLNGLWFAAPVSGVTAAHAGGDHGSPTPDVPTPAPAQATPTPAPTQQAQPQAVNINVNDDKFEPASQTVAVGTKITWTWVGRSSHSIVGTFNGQEIESAIQRTGTFEFTPTSPGVFEYICGVHGSSMSGRIIVQ